MKLMRLLIGLLLLCLPLLDGEVMAKPRPVVMSAQAKLDNRLFDAVFEGKKDQVLQLLQQGANADSISKFGMAPLHRALVDARYDLAAILMRAGAKLSKFERSLLFQAAADADLTLLKFLLQHGVPVERYLTRDGGTALMVCAENTYSDDGYIGETRRAAAISLLVEAGAAVDRKDRAMGEAALHKAIGSGSMAATRALIACGANPNLRNREGMTPLHMAVDHSDGGLGNPQGVRQVLYRGRANLELGDEDGNTPLQWAVISGYGTVVDELLQQGALVNARNKYKQTPLMLTMEWGRLNIARKLLAAGADPACKDAAGHDIFFYQQAEINRWILWSPVNDPHQYRSEDGEEEEGDPQMEMAEREEARIPWARDQIVLLCDQALRNRIGKTKFSPGKKTRK